MISTVKFELLTLFYVKLFYVDGCLLTLMFPFKFKQNDDHIEAAVLKLAHKVVLYIKQLINDMPQKEICHMSVKIVFPSIYIEFLVNFTRYTYLF